MRDLLPAPIVYDAAGVFVTNRYGDRIFVGSVWADNDPRCEGRTVRVNTVDSRYAYCEVLTAIGGGTPKVRQVRLMIDRLHATKAGYRLVENPSDATECEDNL